MWAKTCDSQSTNKLQACVSRLGKTDEVAWEKRRMSPHFSAGHFYEDHHRDYYCLFACFAPLDRSMIRLAFSGNKRRKENYVSEAQSEEGRKKMLCMRTQESANGKKCRRKKKLIFVLTGARIVRRREHDVLFFRITCFTQSLDAYNGYGWMRSVGEAKHLCISSSVLLR